jgi:hypothetical protein
MSTTTQPLKPKRRWCQFSLLTLLVVMTVAIVAFGGWVQYRRYRARENRDRVARVQETVAAIEDLGEAKYAIVEVTSKYKELRSQTLLEGLFDDPGGPDDPIGGLNVTSVYFSEVTDADLQHLKGLTTLKSVTIGYRWMYSFSGIPPTGKTTDAGLEHLNGLTNLEELGVTGFGINITDAGLEHLKGLTSLKILKVTGAAITDTGLTHLTGLTNLKYLTLGDTQATDEGVKKLQQALPQCYISH